MIKPTAHLEDGRNGLTPDKAGDIEMSLKSHSNS